MFFAFINVVDAKGEDGTSAPEGELVEKGQKMKRSRTGILLPEGENAVRGRNSKRRKSKRLPGLLRKPCV